MWQCRPSPVIISSLLPCPWCSWQLTPSSATPAESRQPCFLLGKPCRFPCCPRVGACVLLCFQVLGIESRAFTLSSIPAHIPPFWYQRLNSEPCTFEAGWHRHFPCLNSKLYFIPFPPQAPSPLCAKALFPFFPSIFSFFLVTSFSPDLFKVFFFSLGTRDLRTLHL